MSLARSPLPIERPFTVGSFLLVAVATIALFAPTMGGYLAVLNADAVGTSVTDAAVTDGELALTVEVRNPTGRPIEVYSGRLQARRGGEFLTTVAGTEVEHTTVPAGGSASIEVTLQIKDGARDRLMAAMRGGGVEVVGVLHAAIAGKQVRIGVDAAGVTIDG